METSEFWDSLYSEGKGDRYLPVDMPDADDPVLKTALSHFGLVEDKTIIDLGCGRGERSLYFAARGANVISVDISDFAIRNLSRHCKENGIDNIKPVKMYAQDLPSLGTVDFVFGVMVLHHIEPFAEFARSLSKVIAPGGKGFFWENNARSKIMIWFRQHLVGKLWVPKYGDPDEFPLMPSEVDEMRKHFDVQVEYPELYFFRMASKYLLRGHLGGAFEALDSYFYRYPSVRQYSYSQYLYLDKK